MLRDKIFFIQGVRFPDKNPSPLPRYFEDEVDTRILIGPDIFRNIFFGVIKMENNVTFTGMLLEFYGESEVSGALFGDGLTFSSEPLYLGDKFVYNLEKNAEETFFVGVYQGPPDEMGAIRCYLWESDDHFFDPINRSNFFSRNDKESMLKQWLDTLGNKALVHMSKKFSYAP